MRQYAVSHKLLLFIFFYITAAVSTHNVSITTRLSITHHWSTNCWQLGTNWTSALLIRQSGSGALVLIRVLKWKAASLNPNWASSLQCWCCL